MERFEIAGQKANFGLLGAELFDECACGGGVLHQNLLLDFFSSAAFYVFGVNVGCVFLERIDIDK